MSDMERKYSEALAIASMWARTKFVTYLLGMKFTLEVAHKPLVPLLNSKLLDSLPPRILCFNYSFPDLITQCNTYQAKKYTADAQSQSPLPSIDYNILLEALVEAAMDTTTTHYNNQPTKNDLTSSTLRLMPWTCSDRNILGSKSRGDIAQE